MLKSSVNAKCQPGYFWFCTTEDPRYNDIVCYQTVKSSLLLDRNVMWTRLKQE